MRSLDETLMHLCWLHETEVCTVESDCVRRVLENAVSAGIDKASRTMLVTRRSCTELVWVLYRRVRDEVASRPAGPGVHGHREPMRRLVSHVRTVLFVAPPLVDVQTRLSAMLRAPKFRRADGEAWVQSDPVLLAAMIAYGASLPDEAGSSWTVAATPQDAWRALRLRLFAVLPSTRDRHRARRVDKEIRDGVRVFLPSVVLQRSPSDATRMYHARLGPGKTRDRLTLEFGGFVKSVGANDLAAVYVRLGRSLLSRVRV